MGHDISGFHTTDKEQENEVAYLRRGAFNPLNTAIYEVLNCSDCNGGVSGNGKEKEFKKEDLLKALKHIGTNEDLEPEREFLNNCLTNIDDKDKILICFG